MELNVILCKLITLIFFFLLKLAHLKKEWLKLMVNLAEIIKYRIKIAINV